MSQTQTTSPGASSAPGISTKRFAADRSHWLLASPLVAVLALFLILPIATIVVVSFWDYNEFNFFPAFVFENYRYLLTSQVTLDTYLKTL